MTLDRYCKKYIMDSSYIRSYFSGIQDVLLNQILQSNDEILIAVAWFTNRELFDGIIASMDKGVKCSCLLHDDIINKSQYNLDFARFIEKGGQLKFYSSENGLMHNKFCIIDKQVLFTGSYNWTYSAEYKNKESLISTNDCNVCSSFIEYFKELWELYPAVTTYQPMEMKNIFNANFQNVKNELRQEYGVMADRSIIDGQVLKKIDIIRGLTSSRENVNKMISGVDKFILKFNIGMRCRVDGVDNQTLNIVKKGTKLPIRGASVRYTNIPDFPKEMCCELLLGDNNNADENITLCKLVNDSLPKMKSGKLDMRAIVDIDTNGYIKLSNVCVNNNQTVITSILAPDIVEQIHKS